MSSLCAVARRLLFVPVWLRTTCGRRLPHRLARCLLLPPPPHYLNMSPHTSGELDGAPVAASTGLARYHARCLRRAPPLTRTSAVNVPNQATVAAHVCLAVLQQRNHPQRPSGPLPVWLLRTSCRYTAV